MRPVPLTCSAAVLSAFLLGACGGSADPEPEAAGVAVPSPSAASPSSPSSPPTAEVVPSIVPTPAPAATPAGTEFEITFAEGKASGDTGRIRVAVGEQVTLRVKSLRSDEVHLHGYDLSAPVDARRPAVLTFTASVPGVFELELERLGFQLASLQVG